MNNIIDFDQFYIILMDTLQKQCINLSTLKIIIIDTQAFVNTLRDHLM